jgi:hypothetical protein
MLAFFVGLFILLFSGTICVIILAVINYIESCRILKRIEEEEKILKSQRIKELKEMFEVDEDEED